MKFAEATIRTPTDVVTLRWTFGHTTEMYERVLQYFQDGVLSNEEAMELVSRVTEASYHLSMDKLLDDVLSIRALA